MRKRKTTVFIMAVLMLVFSGLTAFAAEKPKNAADETRKESVAKTGEKAGKKKIAEKKSRAGTEGVKSIEITREPYQTKYYGLTDWYSREGMEIRLTYEDDTTVELYYEDGDWWDADDNWYDDINVSYIGEFGEEETWYAYGEQSVEVSCNGVSAQFSITVLGVKEISLKSVPNDAVYYGHSFYDIPVGLQLDAVFTDGSEGVLEYGRYGWETAGQEAAFSVSYAVDSEDRMTVQIDECSVSFPITVKEVQDISISKTPDTTVFYGQTSWFVLYGLELNVTLTDGTSEVICYEEELGWRRKSDDAYVYAEIKTVYEGKRYNDEEEGYWEYGTWPVKVDLDGKTASFMITVVPYTVVNGGSITAGALNQAVLQEHHIYRYTFTPQETALYVYRKMEGVNEAYASMKYEGTFCEDTKGGWILWAGKTYTFELETKYINAANNIFYFMLNKEKTPAVHSVTETVPAAFMLDGAGDFGLCTFVPAVSGVYLFYSDEESEQCDPYADLWNGNMTCYIEENDDGAGEGFGLNFALRAYLTAGETYVCMAKTYETSSSGASYQVHVKREEDTCTHAWKEENIYKSTCGTAGWRMDYCENCGLRAYVTLPKKPHTFGSYVLTREATALQTGVQTRTCSVCGQTESRDIPKLTPVLKLNASGIPLKVKQSTTALKVTEMAKGDAVAFWKSSNTKIVKVTGSGKITAGKKTGKATLTVTLKSGKSAKVTVKVQKKKVTTKKIKVPAKKITLKKGQSYTIAAVLNPITSQDKAKYSTSKKSVAAVSSKGVVKAKKPGTAKITVKSGKKKATVTVKVTK